MLTPGQPVVGQVEGHEPDAAGEGVRGEPVVADVVPGEVENEEVLETLKQTRSQHAQRVVLQVKLLEVFCLTE